MPDPGVFISVLVAIPTAAAVAFRWFGHRERMAQLEASPPAAPADDRLARVERAVEAIAVEVERLGEGQRFVTRLLTEQQQRLPPHGPPSLAPSPRERVNTPH